MSGELVFCYHDVVMGPAEPSGFPGPDAATYKIIPARFTEHIKALEECRAVTPFRISLTFDDGGSSACRIADILEAAGRRGYFFITSGLIGGRGFLSRAQIADLHRRGHEIGSHGKTHRGKMSRMPEAELAAEWSDSVAALSSLTGTPILTASVPSGFYSPRVAHAAAAAGIRHLYTQQPTTRSVVIAACEIHGRFTMRAWTPAARVLALAKGNVWPRFENALLWRIRETAKTVAGSAYGDLRRAFFRRGPSEDPTLT
jgi:peptidoglycan/xylan/chitin deacetylase (PgdA/CDA1 family)